MKMKKAVSILVICMLVISLIGCTKETKPNDVDTLIENDTGDTDEKEDTPAPEESLEEELKEEAETPNEEEAKEEEQPSKGPRSAEGIIEAEDFDDSFDVVVEGNSDTEGAQGIGGINNGDYTSYNIDFGDGGYNKILFRAASWYEEGGDVEVRLGSADGELIGTCHVPGTGDWSIWDTAICEVEGLNSLTGEQLVYFVYTNGGDWLFNLNWFQFEK